MAGNASTGKWSDANVVLSSQDKQYFVLCVYAYSASMFRYRCISRGAAWSYGRSTEATLRAYSSSDFSSVSRRSLPVVSRSKRVQRGTPTILRRCFFERKVTFRVHSKTHFSSALFERANHLYFRSCPVKQAVFQDKTDPIWLPHIMHFGWSKKLSRR